MADKKKKKQNCESIHKSRLLKLFEQQQFRNQQQALWKKEIQDSDDIEIIGVEEATKANENICKNKQQVISMKSTCRLSLKRKSAPSPCVSSVVATNENIRRNKQQVSSACSVKSRLSLKRKSASSPCISSVATASSDVSIKAKKNKPSSVAQKVNHSSPDKKHNEKSVGKKECATEAEIIEFYGSDPSITDNSVKDEGSCSEAENNSTDTCDTKTVLNSQEHELSKLLDLGDNVESSDKYDNKNSNELDEEKPRVEEDNNENEYRIPYYLENFQLIVSSVTQDKFHEDLFNESDKNYIEIFNNLSENAQKLYVRVFQRQNRWLRKDKIKYPKISEDLTPVLEELVSSELLLNETTLTELDTILNSLPAPELKELAKSLRLNTHGQMQDIIQSVIKHTRESNITSFFKVKGESTEATVIKRAKRLLGSCYRLQQEARAVFMRTITLFCLHQTRGDEDEQAGGNLPIFQMLMTNIGRMVYPDYVINRTCKVFPSRDHLLSFETALQQEFDMREVLEKKDFQASLEMYRVIKPAAEQIFCDKECESHTRALPVHLRAYTAGASYSRMLSLAVETLEKLRRYQDAVELLEDLLSRELYLPDYRGRWYDRLALNTDQHLKHPAKALDICQRALDDSRVRTGHRYSILQRAHRICHSPSHKKLLKRWKDFKDDPMNAVKEAPKVIIEGRQVFQGTTNQAWVASESLADGTEEIAFLKHVEDVALKHYHDNGYPEGIHGEGGTFRCLLGLFLWDVIYSDVPDVFLNQYQSYPLDIISDTFYTNRQLAIDNRLKEIRQMSPEELGEEAASRWEQHYNTLCLGVNWERFTDSDHVKGLVTSLGGHGLAGIIERLVKDMRHTSGGGPDLTVWNAETRIVKVVEVKGPGDRLSTKQILWLDYLMGLGMDAEVCHVQAVCTKKLRPSHD